MYAQARYLLVGDRGISVEFGNELDEQPNLLVHKMRHVLRVSRLEGVIETTPTIRSLLVHYDPRYIRADRLVDKLRDLEKRMVDISIPEPRRFEIPAVYGGKYGPDLEAAAQLLQVTPEEIVKKHSGREYVVLQTGFIGGSVYYKVPPPLDSVKRRKTPNLDAPGGAILLAGGMGTLKAVDGLTGFLWIGTCPLRQWQPEKDPPLLILAGDRTIFCPIDETEFIKIKQADRPMCPSS
jgi:KipI family sensor histidine kinase inhibitor